MVCYVNGIAPSNGNAKTDSIPQNVKPEAGSSQKSASEKLQEEFKKLYEEAKKVRSTNEIKLLEEKELEAEKARLEAELHPNKYKNMSNEELYYEAMIAARNNSPELEAINAEARSRFLDVMAEDDRLETAKELLDGKLELETEKPEESYKNMKFEKLMSEFSKAVEKNISPRIEAIKAEINKRILLEGFRLGIAE